MKNKLVLLRDGKTTCMILDSVIINGNTCYLVMETERGSITTIKPSDIWNIVKMNDKTREYETIKNFEFIKN